MFFVIQLVTVAADPVADPAPKLRVGISLIEPFIIQENPGNYTGYSIDLWEAVMGKNPYGYEYVLCKGVQDKLDRLEKGEIDVAIGDISMNQEREQKFDFTHSFLHSGLAIMTKPEHHGILKMLAKSLLSEDKPLILFGLLLLIIFSGHLIWLAERGSHMFHTRYFPGVIEGMYWAMVTASTVGYGDKTPLRWKGRLLAAIVILLALPIFAFFTAEMASSFTLLKFKGTIDNPQELANQQVGVVEGTTSVEAAVHYRCRPVYFPNIEQAIRALDENRVSAVIYDSPVLWYHAAHHPRLVVSRKIFSPQFIGWAIPKGSPLRKEFNIAILDLYDEQKLTAIRTNWFGDMGP